jgi:predicted RNA-binding Zn-ribbon protein involved in translation (DUF1610 family)
MSLLNMEHPLDFDCPWCGASLELRARRCSSDAELVRGVEIQVGKAIACSVCGRMIRVLVRLEARAVKAGTMLALVR